MAMDRIERTGLATAMLIHVLLAGGLWVGMLGGKGETKPPPSINVSLVGEIAPVSTAPDAIQEDAAPSSLVEEEPALPASAAPEAPAPIPVPTPKATPKAASKKPVKKKTPSKKSTKKSGGFGKDFGQKIAGISGSGNSNASKSDGKGKAAGNPAAKSGAQVRRSVSTALGSQIKPYLTQCITDAPEISRLRFLTTVRLDRNGRALSTKIGRPSGVTATNSAQVQPIRNCISKAINAASPFRGLDPEYHDVWKNHRMLIKPS